MTNCAGFVTEEEEYFHTGFLGRYHYCPPVCCINKHSIIKIISLVMKNDLHDSRKQSAIIAWSSVSVEIINIIGDVRLQDAKASVLRSLVLYANVSLSFHIYYVLQTQQCEYCIP